MGRADVQSGGRWKDVCNELARPSRAVTRSGRPHQVKSQPDSAGVVFCMGSDLNVEGVDQAVGSWLVSLFDRFDRSDSVQQDAAEIFSRDWQGTSGVLRVLR